VTDTAPTSNSQQSVASVRSQIARIGGLARAANYDAREVTKAARRAFTDRWIPASAASGCAMWFAAPIRRLVKRVRAAVTPPIEARSR
jgi:hypothetical protein